MMNSRERYLAVLNGQTPDCLPRVPILMQWAAEHIGSNYGAFAADWRVLTEANLRIAAEFGMDQVSAISDPYRETQGFGAAIEFIPSGVPRCKNPPLAVDRDFSKLATPDPLRSARMLDRIEAVRHFKKEVGQTHSILGWVEGAAAEAADLRGVSNFMMDLVLDEAYAGALMDHVLFNAIAFARAQVEAGADTVGVGDAIASQTSPDTYERLILPREAKLVQAIHAAGGKVRLHICGNIAHLLPGIATLGVDVIDVDHMVPLAKVREALGPRVTLAGNLDPVNEVRFSTPEKIRAAVRRCYQEAGLPYLVGAGCEIPAGTPPENLAALCEAVAVQD
jgi:MtaA/CmuA family methyltransferase